jgi:isocitrate/isopropylmalate dehydrogenase
MPLGRPSRGSSAALGSTPSTAARTRSRKHQVALKDPCTTPHRRRVRLINVKLRQNLDLYAAVRPIRNLNGVAARFTDVDLVVIRENTEGLYSGREAEVVPDVVTSTKVVTKAASIRIARWAFRYARQRGRKKVTVFHKANIMKRPAIQAIDKQLIQGSVNSGTEATTQQSLRGCDGSIPTRTTGAKVWDLSRCA